MVSVLRVNGKTQKGRFGAVKWVSEPHGHIALCLRANDGRDALMLVRCICR